MFSSGAKIIIISAITKLLRNFLNKKKDDEASPAILCN